MTQKNLNIDRNAYERMDQRSQRNGVTSAFLVGAAVGFAVYKITGQYFPENAYAPNMLLGFIATCNVGIFGASPATKIFKNHYIKDLLRK